ncbi:hypothetical protein [Micromonospora qiuiae]|nr:hypothetical protein [Micromonospora qiuiae]
MPASGVGTRLVIGVVAGIVELVTATRVRGRRAAARPERRHPSHQH